MDYKKKYKELVGKIEKAYLFAKSDSTKAVLEEIRPELKESEDERIREVLIHIVKGACSKYGITYQYQGVEVGEEKLLAWLEKQGEPNPYSGVSFTYNGHTWGMCARDNGVDILLDEQLFKHLEKQGEKESDPRYKYLEDLLTADDIYQMSVNDAMVEEAKTKAINALSELEIGKLLGLEKRGEQILANSAKTCKEEQKPVDKVEPKFKVGEWLTENHPNSYARFVQILEIVNVQGKNRYRISRDLHNDEDIVECLFVEDNWHSFNIQDAKDADVLATSAGAFIYNGNNGGGSCPGSYCGINSLGRFQTGVKTHWTWKNVCPATKEQRDTLMKAMVDAGHTFDFEKKELKKIKQKPAWSEEDEKNLQGILDEIEANKSEAPEYDIDTYNRFIDWLKSLKDRVGCEANCTTMWKPSEEQMKALDEALSLAKNCGEESAFDLRTLHEQLKKL